MQWRRRAREKRGEVEEKEEMEKLERSGSPISSNRRRTKRVSIFYNDILSLSFFFFLLSSSIPRMKGAYEGRNMAKEKGTCATCTECVSVFLLSLFFVSPFFSLVQRCRIIFLLSFLLPYGNNGNNKVSNRVREPTD